MIASYYNNYYLSNFVSSLSNSKYNKTVSIQSYINVYPILNILVQEGFIYNYKNQQNNNILLYLKHFKNKPVINRINLISTLSKIKTITFLDLKKHIMYSKGSLLILSTNFGILSGSEAYKKKIGGILLLKIN
jgi:ribosomal protein S8